MKADYRPFKLFQLSLLWRVSVSQSFFCKPVHLGQFEKKLRNLLLNGDPGKQFDFPCMLTDLRLPGSTLMDFIERPSSGLLDGIQIVRMIMGGYVWWFMYDGVPQSFGYKELFMDENGEFLVLIDDSGTIPMQFRESMKQAGRPLPKSFLDLPRSAKRKKG